jgi:hypothetical protein
MIGHVALAKILLTLQFPISTACVSEAIKEAIASVKP